jgi:hypothetical protein
MRCLQVGQLDLCRQLPPFSWQIRKRFLQTVFHIFQYSKLWLDSKYANVKAQYATYLHIHIHTYIQGSRDSAVGIATGYGIDGREVGVRVPVESRIFSSPRRPDRLWGFTQPPIQWIPWALSPGAKRPECEADHSPTTSAEFKKMWIYTSTSPYAFMA